ncbi:hypothetical protein PVAP13_1NG305600 [Panicum virgatum]|uniref:CASP-like protein n=1 Tax=Panicum virgatum TaxID=38727 RepID=A0A8T0WZ34_PANVG|nr:hypothetical protein PVAP13_1NG305600 [Panicum virgatum]
MALSRRTVWVGAGLGARLLMVVVLAATVQLTFANQTRRRYADDFYKLQSYSYTIAAAVIGMAGAAPQVPVAVYLLCRSKQMAPSTLVLDVSMYTDVVVTVLLASGVSAGFGATVDALRYVHHVTWWDDATRQDLIRYDGKAYAPVVFLPVGTVLSVAATVVSARLWTRAANDDVSDL